jgi:Lipase (class 3)
MACPNSISAGFNFEEAELLLQIAQQTYANTPGEPVSNVQVPCPVMVEPPPAPWQIDASKTPTETTLLDNFWQVWRNGSSNQYVIAVRGTVGTPSSIFEDIFLPLIKARLEIGDLPFALNFAQDEGDSPVVAGVHAGFLLGLLLMLISTDAPLAVTLTELAAEDAEVYVTGHSQGASVALLLTSLVRHTPLFQGPTYKTYVFAPAKPGNDHYAYDFDQIAGEPGFGFSVVNTQDWVPQVPLTLQGLSTVNRPNPVFEFSGQVNPAIPPTLSKIVQEAEAAAALILEDVKKELEKLIGELTAKLVAARFPATTASLGLEGAPRPLGSSIVTKLLDDLLDLVLPSLNFAKAGVLVPVFGTPGGNPDDPKVEQFDAFWQHHLCNYLFYLQQQYGGGC